MPETINLIHSRPTVIFADPAAVDTFCERFGMSAYLQSALHSVESRFSPTRAVRVSVERDPEFPDEWLELDVTLSGGLNDVSQAYDNYTKDWLAEAPAHLAGRLRLSLNLEQ